jgi:hypothetical protein
MRTAHLRRFSVLSLLLLQALLALPAFADHPRAPEAPVRVAQAGGILKVYSNIKGARVFLNDEEIGKTPTIRLLPPGKYKVRLVLQGYETYEEQLEILANKAVTVNATLTKIVGSIEVVANVDGARVFLDGQEKGQTPNVALEDLPSGAYQIEVKKPGYAPYTGPITVKPNVRLKLRVELVPNAAVVTLASNPPGARIFLDDKEAGQAPVTLDSVDAGRHALRFELAGHGTFYRVFQVAVGEKLEINADLGKAVGGIRVRTKMPGADVYLEGSYIGRTPLLIEKQIQPGQYSLRISRTRYADFIQPVVIENGRTTRVAAELIPLDRANRPLSTGRDSSASTPLTKKWWFWTIVGGAVAVAAGGTTAAVLSQPEATPPPPTGDVIVTLP